MQDDDGNFQGTAASDEGWAVRAEPTDLLIPWPGDDVPEADTVLSALGGTPNATEIEPDDPVVAWARLVELPDRGIATAVWCEPAWEQASEELGDPAVSACRWVIGLETRLDGDAPAADYAVLLGRLATAAPDATAVLDVNTSQWHTADSLEALRRDPDAGIDSGALWVVHVVRSEQDDVAWIRTQGLWRCGRPELEMLEVPNDHVETACELMDGVAHLLLEDQAPESNAPMEIGADLFLDLKPWEEIAPAVPEGHPGGMADRDPSNDDAQVGIRAVLLDVDPEQSPATWPADVIHRLEQGEAAVYMTDQATTRQKRLAQSTWSSFTRAFAHEAWREGPEPPEFLVKAAPGSEENEGHEHVWLRLHGLDDDELDGELLNDAMTLGDVAAGDRLTVRSDEVTDWRITTSHGAIGPARASIIETLLTATEEDS